MAKVAPPRILVVKPSSLGDIVHTFPALKLLHDAYPDAVLDFMVHPAFAEALDYSPWPVERKIFFERAKLGRAASFCGEFRKLVGALRARRYELVIDFQGLFRSAFFARVAAGFATPVAGFAASREITAKWFYSKKIPVRGVHAVERNVKLVNRILGSESPVPELDVPPPPAGETPPWGVPRRYLLLVPGGRWHSKRFPTRLFAESARMVKEKFPGVELVIAGGADECESASELRRELGGEALDLCGKTSLAGLFELVRHAAGVICNDSGPMHVAALMKRPLCAFFGPTRLRATGPWGSPEFCRVFRREELKCLECMRKKCRFGDPPCFGVEARQVADAMCDMLTKEGDS